MDEARVFVCVRCLRRVSICTFCDRGQRYCGAYCSGLSRRESMRAAGRRYQQSRQGRFRHAERQKQYRLRCRQGVRRKIVTHQGSPMPLEGGPLSDHQVWLRAMSSSVSRKRTAIRRCDFCERPIGGGATLKDPPCVYSRGTENRTRCGPTRFGSRKGCADASPGGATWFPPSSSPVSVEAPRRRSSSVPYLIQVAINRSAPPRSTSAPRTSSRRGGVSRERARGAVLPPTCGDKLVASFRRVPYRSEAQP